MKINLRHLAWGAACGLLGLSVALRMHFELALTSGNSMAPTLESGDLLLVERSFYQKADPHRGDVVLARLRGELITKRVVGLPHEEVELKQGTLYINGLPFLESHPMCMGPLDIGKGMLCAGRYALLGDNRDVPITLLVHGVVPKEDIVGKIVWAIHFDRWPGGILLHRHLSRCAPDSTGSSVHFHRPMARFQHG
jgi:signal peptidase I